MVTVMKEREEKGGGKRRDGEKEGWREGGMERRRDGEEEGWKGGHALIPSNNKLKEKNEGCTVAIAI